MAVVAQPLFTTDFTKELDQLLFAICEELQLPPSRHLQADERYKAVVRVLESTGSPFAALNPKIYPQGSMALGTTVYPLSGPHDLDFVLEIGVSYRLVNPITLIQNTKCIP